MPRPVDQRLDRNQTSPEERIARAIGYPYPAPERSYLFRNGEAHPIDEPVSLDGRTAVVAIGSNRSPAQLGRKFADDVDHEIPVTAARLHGFDIVYAAAFTRYGAVPALAWPKAEATVSIHITWLNDRQLDIMHATEGTETYRFDRLESHQAQCDVHGPVPDAYAYLGAAGALAVDGQPVGLSAITATGGAPRRHDQATVHDIARTLVAPGMDRPTFIDRLVEDAGFRREARTALPSVGAPTKDPGDG